MKALNKIKIAFVALAAAAAFAGAYSISASVMSSKSDFSARSDVSAQTDDDQQMPGALQIYQSPGRLYDDEMGSIDSNIFGFIVVAFGGSAAFGSLYYLVLDIINLEERIDKIKK